MEENLGNAIRTLRQKVGMTQEEFAHEIAVTVGTVNRWENAHGTPSTLARKAIQDFACRYGVTEDQSHRPTDYATRWAGRRRGSQIAPATADPRDRSAARMARTGS